MLRTIHAQELGEDKHSPTGNIPHSLEKPGLSFNQKQPTQHEQGEMSYQLPRFILF